MTALPSLAFLRRHALPAASLACLAAAPAAACLDVPRPRLAATWFVGEAGRLVCRWIVAGDTADPG